MRTPLVLLALAALAACHDSAEPRSVPQFVVETLDDGGQPFRPTRVYWYRAPAGEEPVEHGGACVNEACTRWSWPDEPSGVFFVAGDWLAPHPDPHCAWTAYDARPVERAPAEALTVSLRFERLESCQSG